MVHVAVAQFAPGEDKVANLATAGRLIAEAAGRGAGVVLLPEYAMFTAPRTDQRFVDSAEPLDGAFVSGLSGMAAESGARSEEHTSELQSRGQLVCRLLREKKNELAAELRGY